MATIYFPQRAPNDERANRLVLQRRAIHDRDGSPSEVSVDSEVVASIPTHYIKHIKRFFWREDCIRLVLHLHNKVPISHRLQKNLKMILWYMDHVFKRLVAELPDELDKNDASRSSTFDCYLKVEYWVGRHEPVHVRNYRRSNDRNIDRSDVEELGMCLPCSPVY